MKFRVFFVKTANHWINRQIRSHGKKNTSGQNWLTQQRGGAVGAHPWASARWWRRLARRGGALGHAIWHGRPAGGATGPWSPPGGRLRARRSQRGRRPAAARPERTGGSSRRGSRARLRSVQFVKTTAARDDEGLESTEQVAGTAVLRTPARSTARRGDRAKRWSGQWQEGLGGAAESAQGLGTPAAWHGAGAASGRPRRAPRPRRTTELDASGGVLERASPCSTKRKRRPA